MPRSIIDQLKQFTPNSGDISPEELLFEAGKASVPNPNRWKLLAAGLALSQLITLGSLLYSTRDIGNERQRSERLPYHDYSPSVEVLRLRGIQQSIQNGELAPISTSPIPDIVPDHPPLRPIDVDHLLQ